MRHYKSKKADLSLSTNAIVILILAITILGLGIGFIKKQFGAGTELVGNQLSIIKQQLKDQMKEGGELLTFSFPEQVTKGTPQNIVIGVLNTAANPKYQDDPNRDTVDKYFAKRRA